MEFRRILDLNDLLSKKSHFLFGPRSTGKSYLIKKQLRDKAILIDLLRSDFYLRLSANPTEVERIIKADAQNRRWVVIDEIQRIPSLLDEVQRLIAEDYIFLLTGSSARKLKRGQANLLAGRAWTSLLFPLVSCEIPMLELDRYLRFGGLPQVWGSANPEEELDAYVQTYLQEEIRAEGLIRNLLPFSRFLKQAALDNGNLLNFSQIASDSEVPASTVREYYSILEDTLIGFLLEPWTGSKKRKAIQTAKFYFFDPGVTHTLAGTKSLDRNSNLYGSSFEQFIGMEVRAYLSYRRIKEPLTFWRSAHGHEVDYLIGDHTAIEVKSTQRITPRDFRGLTALAEEKAFKNYYLVSQDRIATKSGRVSSLYWEGFLKGLWEGDLL